MRIVIDIEVNSLVNPQHVWCIVCKDIDTGYLEVFRKVTDDETEKKRFLSYIVGASLLVGHNILEFDLPILSRLLGFSHPPVDAIVDTLLLSRLLNYSRPQGHSLRSYGEEYGLEKISFNDYTKYSPQLEEYCIRDVHINELIYLNHVERIHQPSLQLEQQFQIIANSLHNNGFSFNVDKATKLLAKVVAELENLDGKIKESFPPKSRLVREIHPRVTQHGTLHKGDFRWLKSVDLSEYNGGPFSRFTWEVFNPSSHKQVIDVLSKAKWAPTERTATHIEAERSRQRKNGLISNKSCLTTEELSAKIEKLKIYGWKINETNLNTLPPTAPAPARTLARRILVESRRRTLTEWLALVQDDGRIHGQFLGLGAWTHRMAHRNPNTANIPTDVKLYGKEMRSLWRAPRNRLLVGVDAEGIQLRIFAHYVNDPELTESLVNGKKSDGSDPHSLNRSIIGDICKSRQTAKRYVYALFLGAGRGKLAQILECSEEEAEEALNRILQRYPGFDQLRREIFPSDAKRGYFTGLDGRRVPIPGIDERDRRHLAMSGYLQNGEAIIMKKACLWWHEWLNSCLHEKHIDKWKFVNFVHDEWQTEVANDMTMAINVATVQSQALQWAGEQLNLNCPMAGSYWNDEHQDYTIGPNWSVTH